MSFMLGEQWFLIKCEDSKSIKTVTEPSKAYFQTMVTADKYLTPPARQIMNYFVFNAVK